MPKWSSQVCVEATRGHQQTDFWTNKWNMPWRQNKVHLIEQAPLPTGECYPGITVPCAQSSWHPKANGIISKRRTVQSNCRTWRNLNGCLGRMAEKPIKSKIMKKVEWILTSKNFHITLSRIASQCIENIKTFGWVVGRMLCSSWLTRSSSIVTNTSITSWWIQHLWLSESRAAGIMETFL